MATNTLIPKVAKIHYDDIAKQFELKITFQFMTPLGVFQREVVVTVADLVSAVTQILTIWQAVGGADTDTGAGYAIGHVAELQEFLSSHAVSDINLQAVPPSYTLDGTLDHPDYVFDGATASWGATGG